MIISAINKIKYFLSDKKVTFVVVAITIAARIIQLVFLYNIRVDRMYQVIAMQNFVNGHGISLSKVLPADLSATIYEPLINWPPGYSILLSPFYILFNHNYILAGLTLDILAAIMLIFICRRILKILESPLYLINIFTFLTAFFIYHFYVIASSDAIAITFFLTAVYFALLVLKKGKSSIQITTAIIIFLFLTGFIKYLFIPVVFVIPVFLFLKGYGENRKAVKKTGIISFIFLAFSLIGVLLYQKYTGGSAIYISEPTRGFFPGNLLVAWPTYPASFIKPETLAMLLPGIQTSALRIFQCIHIILFGAAFIFILRRINKSGFKGLSTTDSFFYLAFFLSVAITFLLMFLSLRVAKEESFQGYWWTYVQEPRYYGLVNVMLQIAAFLLYKYYRLNQSGFIKYVFMGLLLLMIPEAFRGIIFTANRITNVNREEYSWQFERSIQQYADAIIQKEKKMYPGENVVVTGSSYYTYYRVGIYSNIPSLTEPTKINDLSSLNSKKPTRLLIILLEKDFPDYQPFLSAKEKELAGYFRGFYFYTTHVNPH